MSPLEGVQVYPSGQRGRAQDPLHSASQVRILPPAPHHVNLRIISESQTMENAIYPIPEISPSKLTRPEDS